MNRNYICAYCKKQFQAPQKKRKYCNRICYDKDKIGINACHWTGGQVKRKCLTCGKEFYVDRHVVKKGYGKFCSRSCTGKRNYGRKYIPKKELYCMICDKKFYRYITDLIRDRKKGKCCSNQCRVKYTQRQTSGNKSYRWRGGITEKNKLERSQMKTRNWSREIKVRDDFTCQLCGIKSKKGLGRSIRLHSHHKKSWKSYPELRYDLSNGITLCKDCHKKIIHNKNDRKTAIETS